MLQTEETTQNNLQASGLMAAAPDQETVLAASAPQETVRLLAAADPGAAVQTLSDVQTIQQLDAAVQQSQPAAKTVSRRASLDDMERIQIEQDVLDLQSQLAKDNAAASALVTADGAGALAGGGAVAQPRHTENTVRALRGAELVKTQAELRQQALNQAHAQQLTQQQLTHKQQLTAQQQAAELAQQQAAVVTAEAATAMHTNRKLLQADMKAQVATQILRQEDILRAQITHEERKRAQFREQDLKEREEENARYKQALQNHMRDVVALQAQAAPAAVAPLVAVAPPAPTVAPTLEPTAPAAVQQPARAGSIVLNSRPAAAAGTAAPGQISFRSAATAVTQQSLSLSGSTTAKKKTKKDKKAKKERKARGAAAVAEQAGQRPELASTAPAVSVPHWENQQHGEKTQHFVGRVVPKIEHQQYHALREREGGAVLRDSIRSAGAGVASASEAAPAQVQEAAPQQGPVPAAVAPAVAPAGAAAEQEQKKDTIEIVSASSLPVSGAAGSAPLALVVRHTSAGNLGASSSPFDPATLLKELHAPLPSLGGTAPAVRVETVGVDLGPTESERVAPAEAVEPSVEVEPSMSISQQGPTQDGTGAEETVGGLADETPARSGPVLLNPNDDGNESTVSLNSVLRYHGENA